MVKEGGAPGRVDSCHAGACPTVATVHSPGCQARAGQSARGRPSALCRDGQRSWSTVPGGVNDDGGWVVSAPSSRVHNVDLVAGPDVGPDADGDANEEGAWTGTTVETAPVARSMRRMASFYGDG